MSCHYPIPAYLDKNGGVKFVRKEKALGRAGFVQLNCGMCFGCKADRAREWSIRSYHEAQMHRASSFVTLTYRPETLPPHGSLDPRDLQLFFKRLRNAGHTFRYFACGEYGSQRKRPHYHACIFGYLPPPKAVVASSETGNKQFVNDELTKAWGLGRATFSEFHPNAARYTAHYTAKKLLSFARDTADPETGLKPYERIDLATGQTIELVHEFQRQSMRPGLGIPWLAANWREVFPADTVVMQGREYPPPKAYWKWLKEKHPHVYQEVAQKRIQSIRDRPYLPGARLEAIRQCAAAKTDKLVRPTSFDNQEQNQ